MFHLPSLHPRSETRLPNPGKLSLVYGLGLQIPRKVSVSKIGKNQYAGASEVVLSFERGLKDILRCTVVVTEEGGTCRFTEIWEAAHKGGSEK